MAIYTVGNQLQRITRMPHRTKFDAWRGRLSDREFAAIVDELNERIETGEVFTSSFLPGADWSDTVFHPIYENACLGDEQDAAKFFGLILWWVISERDDAWSFGRYKVQGVQIDGMTYFRIDQP
jgi:hypothetical protein